MAVSLLPSAFGRGDRPGTDNTRYCNASSGLHLGEARVYIKYSARQTTNLLSFIFPTVASLY